MPILATTQNLTHAAFQRAMGATIVRIGDGANGQGNVTLDVSSVTAVRIKHEARALVAQLEQLGDAPTMEEVARIVGNTFLGPMSREHGELRTQILNRRPK